METKDHFYLAKLITATADFGGKIKKSAFEFGCIYPDVNPLTYLKGHTYEGTGNYVRNVIGNLFGRLKTPKDYFDLGQAVHFIGDYFTFPHTPLFKGSLSEHVSYEGYLHEHISSTENDLFTDSRSDIASGSKCVSLLDKMLKRYYGAKKSISDDWSSIRFICGSVALSALNKL